MDIENNQTPPNSTQTLAFKAETRQLLDILIHSLYSDRDIFLRELISNASDALTRMDFEMLTNRDVIDPDVELAIRITTDPESETLTISDTGIGMTADEMQDNLGTIAHSGARQFVNMIHEADRRLSDIIGQFGVGFYSVFMVAESVQVISRSYKPDTNAAIWTCTGSDQYSIQPSGRTARGTSVVIHLKGDAKEYLNDARVKEIIRKHSDFVPFPIYLGDKSVQENRQTALWRQAVKSIEKNDYEEFYKQLTLDFEPPLTYSHMIVDAPVQMYALLFIPPNSKRGIFSLRREDGLKLYSRKVLIQEYCKDLLPEYFRFFQGVVDSEDLPLNVSRESYQSNRVIAQLRKLVTAKAIELISKLSSEDIDKYKQFWEQFGRNIKEGVAIEQENPENLYPLLRFLSTRDTDQLISLDEYLEKRKPDQKEIYYVFGDDPQSILLSPHLESSKRRGYEVLLLTDPIDSFMMVRFKKYKDHPMINVASANFKITEPLTEEGDRERNQIPAEQWIDLIDRFKELIGEQVSEVRMTDRLTDSAARLVDKDGESNPEIERVYRLLKEDFVPAKKVLELNPGHPILIRLSNLPKDDPRSGMVISQVYENALLIEGLHPDPARMIERIQKLIEAALDH